MSEWRPLPNTEI